MVIKTLAEMEKEAILGALRHFEWNRTRASKALGVSIRTLRNRMALYRLEGESIGQSRWTFRSGPRPTSYDTTPMAVAFVQRRQEHYLTQREVARRARVHPSAVPRIEQGAFVHRDIVRAVARVLNLDLL